METFLRGLGTSLDAVGQMAILVLAGFLMVRRRWLGPDTLSDLTRFLIDAVIPCTFILAMTRSFTFSLFGQGMLLAVVSAGWILISWGFGAGFYRLFPGDSHARDRSVTAMMMISNSLYLPLPVILAVTPAPLHDQAVVYVSIVSLPSMLFLWTAGVRLLSGPGRLKAADRIRLVLNPPIVSLFLGVLLSLIPGVRESARGEPGGIVPLDTLFSAMDYLGALLSPLAMIILGGLIASGRKEGRVPLRYMLPLAAVRLVLVPAGVYLLVRSGLTGLPALASTVLILVAAAPPATNHALIARRYGGEWELVSSLQLSLHAFALVTLPMWLSAGLAMLAT
jgi:malate permease and related proteins